MSSEIKVEHKAVVIPGQVLANGMDYLPGEETYRDGDAIRAKILGLANVSGRVMKVTALSGPYMPKVGDTIIGKVSDILMSGWRVQTGTPYSAMLNVRDATQRFVRKGEDLSKILEIGDYVVAKITNVTSQNLIDLTMKEPGLFRIRNGRIIQVAAQKVPRIIGKRGSMISLLKRYTGCKVVVGQNGSVLLDGAVEKEALATKVIRMIEELAHQNQLLIQDLGREKEALTILKAKRGRLQPEIDGFCAQFHSLMFIFEKLDLSEILSIDPTLIQHVLDLYTQLQQR